MCPTDKGKRCSALAVTYTGLEYQCKYRAGTWFWVLDSGNELVLCVNDFRKLMR